MYIRTYKYMPVSCPSYHPAWFHVFQQQPQQQHEEDKEEEEEGEMDRGQSEEQMENLFMDTAVENDNGVLFHDMLSDVGSLTNADATGMLGWAASTGQSPGVRPPNQLLVHPHRASCVTHSSAAWRPKPW